MILKATPSLHKDYNLNVGIQGLKPVDGSTCPIPWQRMLASFGSVLRMDETSIKATPLNSSP